jgi:formate-dependent nitrite reductase membrane component NrfD
LQSSLGLQSSVLERLPSFTAAIFFATNWFGGLVFAPLAIVLGLLVIVFALFKPEWLMAKRVQRKHRHGDKP